MTDWADDSNDDPLFRQYMDMQERLRRSNTAPPRPEPTTTYESWRHVPRTLKTRRQWLRLGRRVITSQSPVARVVYPRFLEDHENKGDWEIIDSSDGITRITSRPTPLFRENQTEGYTPSLRMKAYWSFEDVFLNDSAKDDYIHRTIFDDGDESEWITNRANGNCGLAHDPRRLTQTKIRKHLNQGHVVGIKNRTGKTRFIAIDLDLHGRDREVFLKQASVLLNRFHGDTWHYQVCKTNVSGIHFFKVFGEPKDLCVAHDEIRTILQRLDAQHPDLRDRAKASGMKALADLEVYPSATQGFRLPFAHNRWMILDDYVSCIARGNRRVADVERYVDWLTNPNRKHKSPEHILQYLSTFTSDAVQLPDRPARIEQPTLTERNNRGWTSRQRQLFKSFWVDGDAQGISFNEHVVVLARTARWFGHSQEKANATIKRMARGLPTKAWESSQRLLHQRWDRIDRTVETTVRYAYSPNTRQQNSTQSETKLLSVASRYRSTGFDPLDVNTWDSGKVKRAKPTFTWSTQQKRIVTLSLRPVLNASTDTNILQFVEGVVWLATRMKGRQWGHKYFHEWAKIEHPEIRLGFTSKRINVLKTLRTIGILTLDQQGSKRTGCSRWSPGPLAILLTATPANHQLSEADLGKGCSLQGVKARPYTITQLVLGVNAPERTQGTYRSFTNLYGTFLSSIHIGFYPRTTLSRLITNSHLQGSGLDPPNSCLLAHTQEPTRLRITGHEPATNPLHPSCVPVRIDDVRIWFVHPARQHR